MEFDEFLKLVRKRRSIRKFKPDSIPEDHVEKILEAARWAPSGANGQPWEFIVIKDRGAITKLAEAYEWYQEITLTVDMTKLEEYRHPCFRIQAPLDTLEAAREKVLEVGARLALPYEFYQSCRSLIERLGARIETEEFGGRVEVRLRIDAAHLTDLREGVQGLTSGRVSMEQVA